MLVNQPAHFIERLTQSLESTINSLQFGDVIMPREVPIPRRESRKLYNRRFKQDEINFLRKAGVSPKKSDSYPLRLSAEDIGNLVWGRVSPEVAASYNPRFSGYEICRLLQPQGIFPPEEKNRDLEEDIEEEIGMLYGRTSSRMFDDGTNSFDRYFFHSEKEEEISYPSVSPSVADSYNTRFTGDQIAEFVVSGITPKQADAFDTRFDGFEILTLLCCGINSDTARPFSTRFNGYEINGLVEKKIPAEVAKRYPFHFTGFDIAELVENEISAEIAEVFDHKFRGMDIVHFVEAHISPESAMRYKPLFMGCVGQAAAAGISPEVIAQYGKRFHDGIVNLYKQGILPQKANCYPKRFGAEDVVHLVGWGISSFQARAFYEDLSADDIVFLKEMGITTQIMDKKTQENLCNVIRYLRYKFEAQFEPDDYQCIGVGTSSIIILDEGEQTVYKVSPNLDEEVRLLERLQTRGRPRHVITLEGNVKRSSYAHVIALEYVEGKSLKQLLDVENIVFPIPVAAKYAQHIFKGLARMKRERIFHRDLWLGNVMIDECVDQAKIIDLGIATDNAKEKRVERKNRRYGGENDLQSLGQILYKMVTGKHPFNTTIDRSTCSIPEEVRKERERAYATNETLHRRLKQLERNISNKTLAAVITHCLEAKGSEEDYQCIGELLSRIPKQGRTHYHKRFSFKDRLWLRKEGVPPEEANKFDKNFDGVYIGLIYKVGGTWEKVCTYPGHFRPHSVGALIKENCSAEEAERYTPEFDGFEIAMIYKNGVSPEKARRYLRTFSPYDAAQLIEKNCPLEEAEKYDSEFGGHTIGRLYKEEISPETASAYSKRFRSTFVVDLIQSGCKPEVAEQYNLVFESHQVVTLYNCGITPEQAESYITQDNLLFPPEIQKRGLADIFLKAKIRKEFAQKWGAEDDIPF